MKYKFINGNKCIVFSIFKWKGINCFQFQVINEYQNKSIRSKHKWSMYYMQYIVHWPKRLYCQSHISKLWTFLEISQFQISRPHVGARLFHFSIAIFFVLLCSAFSDHDKNLQWLQTSRLGDWAFVSRKQCVPMNLIVDSHSL